jgi:hypothetical protein
MRIKMMGLCLLAAFVVAAVAVSSASAALPEYKVCAKAVKVGKTFTGGFTDKTCTTVSETKTGKYELEPGLGKKTAIKTTAKASKLETEGAGTVECKSSKSTGETAGTKEVKNNIVEFKTCTSLGKKCTSAGQKAGTIKTVALSGVLGYISKAPLKVGLDLTAEKGGNSAEFSCEGLGVRTFGSVIGQQSGDINAISKTFTLTFNETGGKQEITKFEGGPTQELRSEFNLGEGFGPPGGLASGEQIVASGKGEALMIAA